MDYQQALDYLNNFTNYEKVPMPPASANAFNLERVWRFLELLGDPQKSYPSIVIAGTKGKGSTAILTASALQAGGYRTGLYTNRTSTATVNGCGSTANLSAGKT